MRYFVNAVEKNDKNEIMRTVRQKNENKLK